MSQLPLSDDDWNKVCHLFPRTRIAHFGKIGRNPRDVLNAILWIKCNGMSWTNLPQTFPPATTCHIKQLQWSRCGILAEALSLLEISFPVTTANSDCPC